jgi:SsrA-binding protein
MEVAIARGKKLYDKREDIAKRDADRDMDRIAKGKTRM